MPPSPTRRRVFTISSRAATRGRDRVSPNRFSVTSAAAGSQAGAARTRGISLPLLPVADGEGRLGEPGLYIRFSRQPQRRCRCHLRLESYLNAGRVSEIEAFRARVRNRSATATGRAFLARLAGSARNFLHPSSHHERLSRDLSRIYDSNTTRSAERTRRRLLRRRADALSRCLTPTTPRRRDARIVIYDCPGMMRLAGDSSARQIIADLRARVRRNRRIERVGVTFGMSASS